MIKEIACDLFNSGAEVIAQCCNCMNTMGGGIAAQIRERFPEVYEDDQSTVKGDRTKLGTVRFVRLTRGQPPFICANLYGQYKFGAGARHLNYEAIYRCFTSLNSLANTEVKIAVPWRIGCNLAGGDWRIVQTMLNSIFEDSPRQLIICHRTGDP